MQIKRYMQDLPGVTKYGFNVFNADSTPLPKGMFNYFMATATPKNNKTVLSPYPQDNDVFIEFSIQSATGDSSDFCDFSYRCETIEQAMAIVDTYHNMIHDHIYALDNVL